MKKDDSSISSLEHFAAYLDMPTSEQIQAVLASGMVTVDTNILTRLLSVNDSSANYLIDALSQLGSRFFITHMVALEFKRSRSFHVNSLKNDEHSSAVSKALASLEQSVLEKVNRKFLVQADKDLAIEKFSERFDALREYVLGEIIDAIDSDQEIARRKAILRNIYSLSEGKVRELSDEAFRRLVTESLKRVDSKTPPGYNDAKKEDGGYGDGVIWLQSMDVAVSAGCDLLIISDDSKPDWVDKNGSRSGQKMREEYSKEAGGKTFVLLSSLDFVKHWAEYKQASIPDSVIDSFDVEKTRSEVCPSEEFWDMDNYIEYLEVLSHVYPRYADILETAVNNGGEISREEVLQLLGREEGGHLTRFVLPFRTVAEKVFPSPAGYHGRYMIFHVQLKNGRAEYYNLSSHMIDLHEEMVLRMEYEYQLQQQLSI